MNVRERFADYLDSPRFPLAAISAATIGAVALSLSNCGDSNEVKPSQAETTVTVENPCPSQQTIEASSPNCFAAENTSLNE